jgi:hypothetical protein
VAGIIASFLKSHQAVENAGRRGCYTFSPVGHIRSNAFHESSHAVGRIDHW